MCEQNKTDTSQFGVLCYRRDEPTEQRTRFCEPPHCESRRHGRAVPNVQQTGSRSVSVPIATRRKRHCAAHSLPKHTHHCPLTTTKILFHRHNVFRSSWSSSRATKNRGTSTRYGRRMGKRGVGRRSAARVNPPAKRERTKHWQELQVLPCTRESPDLPHACSCAGLFMITRHSLSAKIVQFSIL